MKKFMSVILTVAIIICAVPLGAFTFTASAETVTSGTTGDCIWSLDGTTLKISGNGEMADYSYTTPKPWGNEITSVIIDDGVTHIGDMAFYQCYSLSAITIPDSVISIGREAFFNTAYYKNSEKWKFGALYIGNHLIVAKRSVLSGEYYVKEGTKIIAESAFWDCNITGINIPDSVIAINDFAFSSCSKLSSVKIGSSVENIGKGVFMNCHSLSYITIPDNVVSIGEGAFDDAEELTRITVSEGNQYYSAVDGVLFDKSMTKLIRYPMDRNISAYSIPESVTSIEKNAFKKCTTLRQIEVPASVANIGDSAFQNCKDLTHINVSEDNEYYLSLSGVLFNKACTDLIQYPNGKKDLEYIVPDGVTTICDYAFYNCDNITAIYLPESVTSIGTYAFADCWLLKSVFVPETVTYIGEDAFFAWPHLTIYGYHNSYIENYANENNISFFIMFNNTDQNGNNICYNVTVDKTSAYTAYVLLDESIDYESYASDLTFAVYDKNGNPIYCYFINDVDGYYPLIEGEKYTIVASEGILGFEFAANRHKELFEDTNESAWYYDAVTYAAGSGIMSGYQNGLFGTADNIQRQDFVVVLARLAGVDLDNYVNSGNYSFTDVPSGTYYEKAILWAADNGITTGYNDGSGKFGVGDVITREQLVTFLYRYAKYVNGGVAPEVSADAADKAADYIDFVAVTDYAKEAVIWALDNGIIKGQGGTHIAPAGNALRCEVAQIMYNIYLNDIF